MLANKEYWLHVATWYSNSNNMHTALWSIHTAAATYSLSVADCSITSNEKKSRRKDLLKVIARHMKGVGNTESRKATGRIGSERMKQIHKHKISLET